MRWCGIRFATCLGGLGQVTMNPVRRSHDQPRALKSTPASGQVRWLMRACCCLCLAEPRSLQSQSPATSQAQPGRRGPGHHDGVARRARRAPQSPCPGLPGWNAARAGAAGPAGAQLHGGAGSQGSAGGSRMPPWPARADSHADPACRSPRTSAMRRHHRRGGSPPPGLSCDELAPCRRRAAPPPHRPASRQRQPRRSHRVPDRGHRSTRRRRCCTRTCQGTGLGTRTAGHCYDRAREGSDRGGLGDRAIQAFQPQWLLRRTGYRQK